MYPSDPKDLIFLIYKEFPEIKEKNTNNPKENGLRTVHIHAKK